MSKNMPLHLLSELLTEMDRKGWWGVASQLKYISIQIDTRYVGRYILKDRDDNVISSQQIVDAINDYKRFIGDVHD